MQIYALDHQQALTSAHTAIRHRNYICPECKTMVRLRGGTKRQFHFYHVKPPYNCRQHGKSWAHIHTQLLFQKQLKQATLEQPFPTIGRIADVFWPEKEIIFEIQCSPISIQELNARNRDYRSLGLTVIWIFHDRRYNRYRLSAAESHLSFENSPFFFTDMTSDGKGCLYHQEALIRKGRRIKRSTRRLCTPQSLLEVQFSHQHVRKRVRSWRIPTYRELFCYLLERFTD